MGTLSQVRFHCGCETTALKVTPPGMKRDAIVVGCLKCNSILAVYGDSDIVLIVAREFGIMVRKVN